MSRPPQILVRKQQAKQANAPVQMQLEVAELVQQGIALHQQGHLAQADVIYQQVLVKQANHFDALHLSGVIALQNKNSVLAVKLIGRAIEINENDAAAYCNLGVALKESNRLEEALDRFDKAIVIKPDFVEVYNNRGNTLHKLKRFEDAVASFDKAVAIKPDYAEAHYNCGLALQELKRLERALMSYGKAIAIKPDYAEAYADLGNALLELNRPHEALACYDKAIEIKPEYPKNPHIILKNNFKKNKKSLSIILIKQINKLRFKFI
jgi:tetratricopeptide (TPR) repeat protein